LLLIDRCVPLKNKYKIKKRNKTHGLGGKGGKGKVWAFAEGFYSASKRQGTNGELREISSRLSDKQKMTNFGVSPFAGHNEGGLKIRTLGGSSSAW